MIRNAWPNASVRVEILFDDPVRYHPPYGSAPYAADHFSATIEFRNGEWGPFTVGSVRGHAYKKDGSVGLAVRSNDYVRTLNGFSRPDAERIQRAIDDALLDNRPFFTSAVIGYPTPLPTS